MMQIQMHKRFREEIVMSIPKVYDHIVVVAATAKCCHYIKTMAQAIFKKKSFVENPKKLQSK